MRGDEGRACGKATLSVSDVAVKRDWVWCVELRASGDLILRCRYSKVFSRDATE
jgi:hypothetical protein